MNKKIFFIMDGRNGATYILNLNSWTSTKYSLQFYKARSIKQKILKNGFKFYLFSLTLFCRIKNCTTLKNEEEISNYLTKISSKKFSFELNDKCSILVSPTRDKIIIHHHNDFFQKFAFGNSLIKVKNEASIYELFNYPLVHFHISNISDVLLGKNNISFKLYNGKEDRALTSRKSLDLVPALVELFNISSKTTYPLSEYIQELDVKSEILGKNSLLVKQVLVALSKRLGEKQIPLGLVHRDFKPWNITHHRGLLIYDFEEAVNNGPPLEDLFNYYIDPEIRTKTSKDLALMIFDKNKVNLYNKYLKKLNLDIEYRNLLYIYLIERTIFWFREDEIETSNNYLNLVSYLFTEFE